MPQVAFITGCAKGIGKAIALRLAADGFDVAINDIASQEEGLIQLRHEIESKDRRCAIFLADVSKEDEVKGILDDAVRTLGPINVMVANAGIILVKPLLEISADEWDRVQEVMKIQVNLRGVFLSYKYAALQMIKQGNGGKIIGACSISGYRPVLRSLMIAHAPQTPAYSVSKWAVRGLTQVAALELAKHNITVNAYCPGIVKTEMWDTIDSTVAAQYGVPRNVPFQKAVEERTALKRAQTPEDVAGLVSFLAGKDSNQITGQSLIVDGGIVFS
ncbi:L-2,3-butanediol dehydrogenase [Aspergillus heterothallicus]